LIMVCGEKFNSYRAYSRKSSIRALINLSFLGITPWKAFVIRGGLLVCIGH
jgi:hypothetical protein